MPLQKELGYDSILLEDILGKSPERERQRVRLCGMRILICPDSFKGTLSAGDAARAMERGIRRVLGEDALIRLLPLGDGGEGSLDCFFKAGAVENRTTVTGPYGEKLEARWLLFPDRRMAYVESAEAAGLTRTERRETALATSFGVGELIREASEKADSILLGLGGSATSDMGLGMAAALGFTFRDSEGRSFIPTGATLSRVASFETPKGKLPKIHALSDVENPLCGPMGAAAVFSPQKGADKETVDLLDRGMRKASDLIDREKAEIPGAGAAGGMGYAVLALLNGSLGPGIEEISRIIGLEEAVKESDCILSGEGSFDRQSLMGKAVGGVAKLAKEYGVPLFVLSGIAKPDPSAYSQGITAVWPLTRYRMASLPNPEETEKALEDHTEALFRTLKTDGQGAS